MTSDIVLKIVSSEDCMAMACLLAIGEGEVRIDEFLRDLRKSATDYDCDNYWLLLHERASIEHSIKKSYGAYIGETKLSYLLDRNVRFVRSASREFGI